MTQINNSPNIFINKAINKITSNREVITYISLTLSLLLILSKSIPKITKFLKEKFTSGDKENQPTIDESESYDEIDGPKKLYKVQDKEIGRQRHGKLYSFFIDVKRRLQEKINFIKNQKTHKKEEIVIGKQEELDSHSKVLSESIYYLHDNLPFIKKIKLNAGAEYSEISEDNKTGFIVLSSNSIQLTLLPKDTDSEISLSLHGILQDYKKLKAGIPNSETIKRSQRSFVVKYNNMKITISNCRDNMSKESTLDIIHVDNGDTFTDTFTTLVHLDKMQRTIKLDDKTTKTIKNLVTSTLLHIDSLVDLKFD